MAVELATIQAVAKPWGRVDLQPWSDLGKVSQHTGELWFTRVADAASDSSLLFKLIFADEPLSIQVHPTDVFAHAHGQPNGKTEAWYILSAEPGSQIAAGLTRRVSDDELRGAITDGSIARLVAWRPVSTGEIVAIPAGTIHAIGAGVVLAEIQQRSDTTFRIHDFGRGRELHVEEAIAVSDRFPRKPDATHVRLNRTRDILVENPHFILERIDLPPRTGWGFPVDRETMVFVLSGSAAIGLVTVEAGCGVFLSAGDSASIETGIEGLCALVSYSGPHRVDDLVKPVSDSGEIPAKGSGRV